MDPVLYSYQTAIESLMRKQQWALAACLAASAAAHLPVHPELSPVKLPEISRLDSSASDKSLVSVKPKQLHSPRVRYRAKPPHDADAKIDPRQRLRFFLERESIKRANSIGKIYI